MSEPQANLRARHLVGSLLLVAGILATVYGAFWISLEGEGGQGHPFAGFGLVVLLLAVPFLAAGTWFLKR